MMSAAWLPVIVVPDPSKYIRVPTVSCFTRRLAIRFTRLWIRSAVIVFAIVCPSRWILLASITAWLLPSSLMATQICAALM